MFGDAMRWLNKMLFRRSTNRATIECRDDAEGQEYQTWLRGYSGMKPVQAFCLTVPLEGVRVPARSFGVNLCLPVRITLRENYDSGHSVSQHYAMSPIAVQSFPQLTLHDAGPMSGRSSSLCLTTLCFNNASDEDIEVPEGFPIVVCYAADGNPFQSVNVC